MNTTLIVVWICSTFLTLGVLIRLAMLMADVRAIMDIFARPFLYDKESPAFWNLTPVRKQRGSARASATKRKVKQSARKRG